MAITETGGPAPVRQTTQTGPVALICLFLSLGILGAGLVSFVVSVVNEHLQLLFTALGLAAFAVVSLVVIGCRRPKGAVEPQRTALALIESRRALSSESGDIPVQFELTVAPDEGRAYRVGVRQYINLVDVGDYRTRGIVVVTYSPERPWKVQIVTEPTPEWAWRAAEERIDSAPESTKAVEPASSSGGGIVGFIGFFLGAAAAVVLLMRADMFIDGIGRTDDKPSTSTSSSSSSSSSGTITSTATLSSSMTASGTASSDSMRRDGEMRRAATALMKGMGTSSAVKLSIEERVMAVTGGFTRDKGADPLIDMRALPYERFPGLVRAARTGLGIKDPTFWQINFKHHKKTEALIVHVTVTKGGASASLEADAKGKITKRSSR